VKRPLPIYFVAAWSFVVLTLQTRLLARLAESYFSEGEDAAHLWGSFRGLLLILVVWHVVRLIQLKAFNRWLSVVSFTLATISVIRFIFIGSQQSENPFIVIVPSSISGLLSLTAGLYLAHRKFREYAVRFVAERERERNPHVMQKVSQETILDDIPS
jgi:hypothetical protein